MASRKSVTIVTFSQIINYGIPIISFPLLVRAFDITSYGIWIEANTLASLVMFATVGLSNALGMIVVNSENTEPVYANALYTFLFVGGILSGLFFLCAPLLNLITIRQPIGENIIHIISITILSASLNQLASQVFRLRKQPIVGASFDVMVTMSRLTAVVLAYVIKDLTVFAYIYSVLQIVVALAQVTVAYRHLHLSKLDFQLVKNFIFTGVSLGIVGQANWFVMYGDRLMLSIFSISTAVAVYAASYQLTMILVALGWPILYFLLPLLGEHWKAGDATAAYSAIKTSSRMLVILLIPAIVGLACIGDALIRILAADDFAQGFLLVAMIATGIGLDILGTVMQYLFYTQGRANTLRNIYLRAALINILANLVAIPLFSYNGAGLTTLITFIYIFYSQWKNTGLPFTDIFDMSVFWRCAVVSSIMAIWVVLLADSNIFRLALAIIGGAVIYGVGLLVSKVMSADELLATPHAILKALNI